MPAARTFRFPADGCSDPSTHAGSQNRFAVGPARAGNHGGKEPTA
jgi:hypothetical protein